MGYLMDNRELLECIANKDRVFLEYRKARHDYNNILQTVEVYLDGDDFIGLKDYHAKLLEKTYLLNKTHFTQLIQIKDIRIFNILCRVLMKAEEVGADFNLKVYDTLDFELGYKTQIYKDLNSCILQTFETGLIGAVVNLKISAYEGILWFCFESQGVATIPVIPKRKTRINRNFICNCLLQDGCLIQEIQVPLDLKKKKM